MGEYAKLKSTGQSIKIGTCEHMYHLRHDQRHIVAKERGKVTRRAYCGRCHSLVDGDTIHACDESGQD